VLVPVVGKVKEVWRPGDVGIVSMYKVWYCELKKPLILSEEEARTYISMMRAVQQGTPRVEKINE
tara:strand:+ start:102 stop:296 length:195 start_codon:yes stop_codon:yes gene_type:complete